MYWPCKDLVLPRSFDHRSLTAATLSPTTATSGFLFVLLHLLTRKRVNEFFHAHLIRQFVFKQLIPNILLYFLLIYSYRVSKVSSYPKLPIPKLILNIRMSFKYHQCWLAFQIPHKLWHWILWWYFYQHVYMIRTGFCFY